jgi:hypothetical protein
MARTRRTTRKSTGRLPIGQLAPQNVPQPQESQPDITQEATLEEEPFEIELVVPESPTAQDSPVEEQQPEDPGTCHTWFLRPKPDAHRMYAQDQVAIHTVRM